MVLTSSAYFIFLAGIFLLYWPVAKNRALALAVILFANLFFYAKWDLFYLWMIPAAATIDFCLGLALGKAKPRALRLGLLLLSVAMNIGILVSFKYMPFLLENYAAFTAHPVTKWAWMVVSRLAVWSRASRADSVATNSTSRSNWAMCKSWLMPPACWASI